MNRDEKAAVIDRLADEIQEAQAIFAVDYRGISVQQAAELRARLGEAGARFRIVKNTLTERAADKAGAEDLKALLEGPTAFTFVTGDAATAAKAIATFRREHGLLEVKGGQMDGETLSIDQIASIARLPARDVLRGQFVGVLASPITGLVRGLASMISGLAIQLQQIQEQGLVTGEAPAEVAPEAEPEAESAAEDARAEEADADLPAEDTAPAEDAAPAEAPGPEEAADEPVLEETPAEPEAEAAEEDTEASEAPGTAGEQAESESEEG